MKILSWIVALGISGAAVFLVFHGTDWQDLSSSLKNMNSPAWLLFYPAVLGFEFYLRSVRWKLLLYPIENRPVSVFFPITCAGFFVNNILPFRAGELARAYWTTQKTKVPFSTALAILAVDRMVDMVCILTFLWALLLFKFKALSASSGVVLFGAAAAGGILVFLFLAYFPDRARRLSRYAWVPERIRKWSDQFITGAGALRNPVIMISILAISFAFWAVDIWFMTHIASLFSISLSFTEGIWLLTGFCLATAIPSAPGFIGTWEAGGLGALLFLGFDKGLTLPFILVLHVSLILSTMVLGIPSLWLAGLRVPKKT